MASSVPVVRALRVVVQSHVACIARSVAPLPLLRSGPRPTPDFFKLRHDGDVDPSTGHPRYSVAVYAQHVIVALRRATVPGIRYMSKRPLYIFFLAARPLEYIFVR